MGKPYSIDLRERVVAAVDSGGLSCHRNLGWASTRPLSGYDASGRRAALRRARWVGTNRRRFRASTVIGYWSGLRQTSHCAGSSPELAERGLKVDYRSVWEFVHAENLSFKKKRRRQRTRPS
jgi:putative transposase